MSYLFDMLSGYVIPIEHIVLHAWVFIQNRVRMGVSWNQVVDDIMETLQ